MRRCISWLWMPLSLHTRLLVQWETVCHPKVYRYRGRCQSAPLLQAPAEEIPPHMVWWKRSWLLSPCRANVWYIDRLNMSQDFMGCFHFYLQFSNQTTQQNDLGVYRTFSGDCLNQKTLGSFETPPGSLGGALLIWGPRGPHPQSGQDRKSVV